MMRNARAEVVGVVEMDLGQLGHDDRSYIARVVRLMIRTSALRGSKRCSTNAARRFVRPAMRVGPAPSAARASATVFAGSISGAEKNRPGRGFVARKYGVRVAPGQKASTSTPCLPSSSHKVSPRTRSKAFVAA